MLMSSSEGLGEEVRMPSLSISDVAKLADSMLYLSMPDSMEVFVICL